MTEWHKYQSEAEFLELRRRFGDLTASTISALFGLDPYSTALKLHLRHRGVVFSEPDRDTPVLRRGRLMEPAVALAVSEARPTWRIEKANVYVRDPARKIGGTPDYFIHNDERGLGVLEAKSVGYLVWERDWLRGKHVPLRHVLQCTTQMNLTGAKFGVVAALLVSEFDMELALVEVPHHPGAWARICDAAARHWHGVETGQEPAADYSKDADAIGQMFPKEAPGKSFDGSGNNELPVILAQRAALQARIKGDEARCEEIENEVKVLLGDAESVSNLSGWRVTFKTSDRAGFTVPPKKIRSLRIYDRRPAAERPDGDADEAA